MRTQRFTETVVVRLTKADFEKLEKIAQSMAARDGLPPTTSEVLRELIRKEQVCVSNTKKP